MNSSRFELVHNLIITHPDDWHVHFRDNDQLQHTVTATANHFSRALVMPNLKPPLTSLTSILHYRDRIRAVLSSENMFTPYMTFFLNEAVQQHDLIKAASYSFILGGKLYPAGATTHSQEGAKSLHAIYPLLDIMQEKDLVLQIHGEVTHGDIFSREALFLEKHLAKLVKNFPKLRIVLEHISTKAAVEFVEQASAYVAATITPHHLLYNRNHLLAGGVKPHFYCLPVLKHEREQKALQQAACNGNPKFFAGTDSAPHAKGKKENACGCAGIYSAPYALPLYAHFFDSCNALGKLDSFMAKFGADFYHLPVNKNRLELIRQPQTIPSVLPLAHDEVVPVAAGETINWRVNGFA